MNITIKNIGLIKEADINLSDLCVIAGENDNGKSTVGKLMFAIIKSISKYEDELEESRKHNLMKAVENVYFSVRRKYDFNEGKVMKLFYPRYFVSAIESEGIKAVDARISHLEKEGFYDDKNKELFSKLKKLISQKYDKESSIKKAFVKVIYSEFRGEISSKKSSTSSVKITEGKNQILDIKFNKNQLSEFDLKDELYFNDGIIIETPMILNFSESIRNSKSVFEAQDKQNRRYSLGRANVAFHIKDLEVKLRESASYEQNLFSDDRHNDLHKKITKLIQGEIKFIRESNEFSYFKDKEQHSIINVASGVKAFGILQMLLSSGFLDERVLIVLDEPEVHLHPNWQLKYAEIIALLVKNDFNILVTTHSSYMIEALEKYARKYQIEANFYLAQDGVIKSENNNKTLSKTIAKLSEPFSVFDELDAESL